MKVTQVLLLVLLSVGVPALCDSKEEPVLQTAPTQAPRSRFAALDDVRLLANGLLQLGQSMRTFVHKTKRQINDIFQKFNIFDRSFHQLSALTSEIKEEEEELKKTTVVLKASNDEIKDLSVQINSKVDSILQEKNNLRDKLEGLEEKLSSMSKCLLPRHQAAQMNSLRVCHLCVQREAAPACVVVAVTLVISALLITQKEISNTRYSQHKYPEHDSSWLCFGFILPLYFCSRRPSRVDLLTKGCPL